MPLPRFSLTKSQLKSGASACRSSILYNIRSKAAAIFKLDEKYFRGNHSVKDCDEILHLLGYDKKENKYDSWPPILYPRNIKNLRKPFRNDALVLVSSFFESIYKLIS